MTAQRRAEHLAVIRERVGDGVILGSEELAKVLITSPNAIRMMVKRGTLPFELTKQNGKLGITVSKFVDYLMTLEGGAKIGAASAAAPRSSGGSTGALSPARKVKLGDAMKSLRESINFWSEVLAELERIDIADSLAPPSEEAPSPSRRPRPL
ncbi:hypothetical protein [Cupriavidus metallidurans]|uniref:hypothetical protein n=1 Tax=Cupriavidus metallidurans TaxID=119219 RepID=UPI0007885C8F|nr:hypothetical protein [Cupriavidus metallidurans]AVA36621.1 hypothetical protein C3Z06_25390 [Cupriavidus metallidurans]